MPVCWNCCGPCVCWICTSHIGNCISNYRIDLFCCHHSDTKQVTVDISAINAALAGAERRGLQSARHVRSARARTPVGSGHEGKAVQCLFQLLHVVKGSLPAELELAAKLDECSAEVDQLKTEEEANQSKEARSRLQETEARKTALFLLQNAESMATLEDVATQLGECWCHGTISLL